MTSQANRNKEKKRKEGNRNKEKKAGNEARKVVQKDVQTNEEISEKILEMDSAELKGEKEKEKEGREKEIEVLKDDIAKKEAKIEEKENEWNELKELQKQEPKPFLEKQIIDLGAQITALNNQITQKEKRLTFLTEALSNTQELQGITENLQNLRFSVKPNKSPSEFAKNPSAIEGLVNHRPLCDDAPPIEIYFPPFAEFVFNCKTIIPSPEDILFTTDFVTKMSRFYGSEMGRNNVILEEMKKLFSVDLWNEKFAGFSTDLSFVENDAFILNIEVKNELGVGGDPNLQNSLYYSYYWSNCEAELKNSLCPTILISIAGSYIGISGGIYPKKFVCEPLTAIFPLLWLPRRSFMDDLARIFSSLKILFVKTRYYYKFLPSNLDQRIIEFPTFEFGSEKNSIPPISNFVFEKQVTSFVFEGKYKSQRAILKFARKYSVDAHKFCYQNGFAPEIFFFYDWNSEWKVICTQFVEGKEWDNLSRPQKESGIDILDRNIQKLHEESFVHGDLRDCNIIFVLDDHGHNCSSVQLIDFDWSGKENETFYPFFINTVSVKWHHGVQPGNQIIKDHDTFWLNFLRKDIKKLHFEDNS